MTPYVLAAYAVAALGVGGVLVWAFVTMRRAETAADALRDER